MSTMSRDSQSKRCSRTATAENSAGIIENKLATLPEEIWEKIFHYTEYRDVLNLKIVSKHFNEMATRAANIKYKWYFLCRKEVPKSLWFGILKHAQHAVNHNIDAKDFHAEREYPVVWKFLYSTWVGCSRFVDEEPVVEKLALDDTGAEYARGHPQKIRFNGNIVAIYTWTDWGRYINFYDILKLDIEPIYDIRLSHDCGDFLLLNKGNDLTLVRMTEDETEWVMENWKVTSQKLINSEEIGRAYWIRICESFGYLCLMRIDEPPENTYCEVEIREVASRETLGTVRIQIEVDQCIHGVQVDGDTLLILSSVEGFDKVYKISIRETQLKEIYAIPRIVVHASLRIFSPCVAVYKYRTQIGFSVSGRKWKTYDAEKDLGLEPQITNTSSLAYEGGILALLTGEGNDIKMIKVGDPDRLDCELKAMPSRTIGVNMDYDSLYGVKTMGFTEYNSKVYFVIATMEELVVLKSR